METYFKAGQKNIEVSICGIKEQSDYLKAIKSFDQKNGIYLSDGLTQKLNRTVGDKIKYLDPYTGKEYQLPVIGIALIIYFVLMYILTKIVIDKNTIPIVVIASFLFCLPLVYVTIKQCFEVVLIKISGYIPVYIPFYLFLEIVGFGMATYLVINYFHKKKMDRIQLTDALKNRE